MTMNTEFVAITIPSTTRQRYLGGMAALNFPSPMGTGDWHRKATFYIDHGDHRPRSFICGTGCETDTNKMLGDVGIYDCTAILNNLRIPHESEIAYAASHARACADLALTSVMHGGSPEFVVLDDWMPQDSDKQEIFDLLDKAIFFLSEEQKSKVIKWKQENVE